MIGLNKLKLKLKLNKIMQDIHAIQTLLTISVRNWNIINCNISSVTRSADTFNSNHKRACTSNGDLNIGDTSNKCTKSKAGILKG